MTKFEESSEEFKNWIKKRSEKVREFFGAYDALVENGVELVDKYTSFQISCILPGHGVDANPSARYYSGSDSGNDHYYCFRCKARLDGIGIISRLRGIRYIESLDSLEKRFGIIPPRFEDFGLHQAPIDKSGGYTSFRWDDSENLLEIIEEKIERNRKKFSLEDVIEFSRRTDEVYYMISSGGDKNLSLKIIKEIISEIDRKISSSESHRKFLELFQLHTKPLYWRIHRSG
jgi:hypothetical protein